MPSFIGELLSPADAVGEAARLLSRRPGGPIILADTQDNPGAGGAGDTVGLLRALMASGLPALAGVVHDPDAAAAAHAAGVGATRRLSVGGHARSVDEAPITAEWVIEAIGTGRFIGTGPFYRGCRFDLGPMALLRFGGLRVAVASRRQQAADQAMFRHLGVEPEREQIIALKSSVHFRADFGSIAAAVLIVVAPGANIADLRKLDYRRLDANVRTSI